MVNDISEHLKELFPENPGENIDIDSKEDEIKRLLLKLSETYIYSDKDIHAREAKIQKFANDFYKIYGVCGYRHLYSRTFQTIMELDDYNKCTTLSENLKEIYRFIMATKPNDTAWIHTANCCKKQYDHINLERYRLAHFNSELEKATEKVENLNKMLSDQKQQYTDYQNELDKLKEQLSSLSGQSITVLGVFACVVFAFTGGFSLIGSTFNNGINTIYHVRFLFTIIFLCFALFNIIFMLIYAISKISKHSINIICIEKDGSHISCPCEKSKNGCCIFRRIRKRYPLLFWVNFVLLLGLLTSAFLWICELLHWIKW